MMNAQADISWFLNSHYSFIDYFNNHSKFNPFANVNLNNDLNNYAHNINYINDHIKTANTQQVVCYISLLLLTTGSIVIYFFFGSSSS